MLTADQQSLRIKISGSVDAVLRYEPINTRSNASSSASASQPDGSPRSLGVKQLPTGGTECRTPR
jgi:hypothetical protein